MTTRKSKTITRLSTALTALVIFTQGCKKEQAASLPAGQPDVTPTEVAVAPPPTAVIVNVDGTSLTEGEVGVEVDRFMAQRGMPGAPPEQMAQAKQHIRRQIVERFIAQRLLIDEAARKEIAVTQEETDEALSELKSSLPEGVTVEEALSRSGVTMERFSADLANDLKVRKLVDERVGSLPDVKEEEIREFFDSQSENFTTPESVHARHVLLQCDEGEDEALRLEKKKKADELRTQLVEGADFAKVAGEHSDCPSKKEGGDLGTFPRGQMVKAFEDAAFSQATNTIGPVVETPFGFHIIQVLAHNEGGTRSFDEVKEDIGKFLDNRRKQEAVTAYIDELRGKATITYADAPEPKL